MVVTHSSVYLTLAALLVLSVVFVSAQQAVLMTSVKALTLRSGAHTAARRVSAIPQLSCYGTLCGPDVEPKVVQCINVGDDGTGNVQWKCETNDLPSFAAFDTLTVSCEGYSYPEDPFILSGSCGLSYSLKRVNPTTTTTTTTTTTEGIHHHQQDGRFDTTIVQQGSFFGGLMKMFIFLALLFLVVKMIQGCCYGGRHYPVGHTSFTSAAGMPAGPTSYAAAPPPPPPAGAYYAAAPTTTVVYPPPPMMVRHVVHNVPSPTVVERTTTTSSSTSTTTASTGSKSSNGTGYASTSRR